LENDQEADMRNKGFEKVNDLRTFLDKLQTERELAKISVEVDVKYEVGAVTRKALDIGGSEENKALLFEKPKGYNIPIAVNVVGNRRRYCMAIGMEPEKFHDQWVERVKKPVEPKIIKDGPCKENIRLGNQVNLFDFPIPIWNEKDGGHYITAPCVISKDPETGVRNVAAYRLMVHDQRTTGILMAPFRHVRIQQEKARIKGERFPVAVAIGVDPSIWIAAVAPFPYGVDEMAMAGALRGGPVELVKCETVPLEVPATSEIVLEGEVLPDVFKEEGPFGEYPGYYGSRDKRHVIEIKAITYRNNPIYQASFAGRPHTEDNGMRCLSQEAEILSQCRHQPIKKVRVAEGGCGHYFVIASIKKTVEGQGKTAALAILGAAPAGQFIKNLIIVDEDVDPFNWLQVEWALSTRLQPERDVEIIRDMIGSELDPSRPHKDSGKSSKLIIDATKPVIGEFPEITYPKKDVMEKVEKEWSKYGIT
jgi:UbiD family decarboxylase